MTASDPNFFLLLILGAFLAWGLYPFIVPALVMLCGLWVLGTHPPIFLAGAAVYLLRKPAKWFLEGLFIGEGVKLSGVFGRLSTPRRRIRQHPPRQPRARARREGQYFPWPQGGDDLPEDL